MSTVAAVQTGLLVAQLAREFITAAHQLMSLPGFGTEDGIEPEVLRQLRLQERAAQARLEAVIAEMDG